MTHTTTTGARMATLLTTAQREALERDLQVKETPGYADLAREHVETTLLAIGVVPDTFCLSATGVVSVARYLLAADARLRAESPPPTALTAREKWLMVEAVQEYADNGHWAGGAATACVTEWLAEVDADGCLTVEHMLAREAPAVSA